MAKLRIQGDSSGYVDLEAPNAASSRTIDLDQIPLQNTTNTFTQNQLISGGDAITQEIRSSGNQAHFRMVSDLNNSSWMISNESNVNRLRIMHTDTSTSTNSFPLYLYEAGYVTMPAQPAFFAYISGSNQTITGGTWTKVNLNTTSGKWNVGSHFDTTNGRFVAPVEGFYFISYTVNFPTGVNGYYYSGLKLNGNFYAYGDGRNIDTQLNDNTLGHGTSIRLNANDYVELWAYRDITGDIATGTLRTHMNGYLLG